MSGNNALQSFLSIKARNLGYELINRFGQPNIVFAGHLQWNLVLPYITKIVLLDDNASYGFVYSTSNIRVSPDQASALAQISGNIIIDQNKGQTTVRCSSLIKNQVSLGFVYDFVNGRLTGIENITDLKNEYLRRYDNNEISNTGRYNPVYTLKADLPIQKSGLSLKAQMKHFGRQSRTFFN